MMKNWENIVQDRAVRRIARRMLVKPRVSALVRRLWPRLHRAALRKAASAVAFGEPPGRGALAVLIVSHELTATGAPKVLLEVIEACLELQWHPVVLAPDDGPYRHLFCQAGAFVIVSDTALTSHSIAGELVPLIELAVCNTVVTAEVVKALMPTTPVAWYFHESELINAMVAHDATLPALIRSASLVWAASDLSARTIRDHGGTPVVLRGACAALVSDRHALPSMTRTGTAAFAVFGSIEQRKGQDLLLEALNRLPGALQREVGLSVYGKPLELAFTEALLARIDAMPGVSYMGAVSPDAATRAILACDVVVVPSRDDPLPLVAVEALSAGRVVICSIHCGISKYLVDGMNAFVASDCTPDALAVAIDEAMKARTSWPAIGAAGRAVYESWFNPEDFRRDVKAGLLGLRR